MNVIRRLETKYEIDARSAAGLCEIIGRHLPCFEYTKGFPYTHVTTVYFDTDRLDLFRRAVSSVEDNVKIRVREYSYRRPDGGRVVLPYCYAEIKHRFAGEVVKQRLRLPKALLGRLLAGEEIWRELASGENDGDLDAQREVYEEIRRFLEVHRVSPRSVIEYRRRVFQPADESLRITFDDELGIFSPARELYAEGDTLRPRNAWEPRRRLEKVIMEVKCEGEYPGWLRDTLASFAPCHISKFTESISALVR